MYVISSIGYLKIFNAIKSSKCDLKLCIVARIRQLRLRKK